MDTRPPKPLNLNEPLTNKVLRRFSCTDTGHHLAKTTVAQLIQMVRLVPTYPAALVDFQDVKLKAVDGEDFLTIDDFIYLTGKVDLMDATWFPEEVVPGRQLSPSQRLKIEGVRAQMMQALAA